MAGVVSVAYSEGFGSFGALGVLLALVSAVFAAFFRVSNYVYVQVLKFVVHCSVTSHIN